jgi:hypothetical protein
VPVVGTVLILKYARKPTLAAGLLSVRPVVLIGLFSYSAYLWHQPLLAFARYIFDDLSASARLMIIIVTLLLGWLSWRFVEEPFRNKTRISKKRIYFAATVCSVFFISIGLTGYLKGGFLYRLPSQYVPVFSYDFKAFMRDVRTGKCFIELGQSSEQYASECTQDKPLADSVLVWGDSHAAALVSGFHENGRNMIQFTAGSCPPIFWSRPDHTSCQRLNEYVMKQIQSIRPATIYLEADWIGYVPDEIRAAEAIKQIRAWVPEAQIYLVGNVPQWPQSLPRALLRAKLPAVFDHDYYLATPVFNELNASDRILAEFANHQGIQFISALGLLCKQQDCLAVTMTRAGPRLTAFDYGHLTQAGSTFLVSKLLKN